MNKDTVYALPRSRVEDFKFDASVADVFENMINRSVPGYHFFLELIGLVTDGYHQPGTNCYDLGCSLGASTLTIRRHLPDSCSVIGIDNSVDMITRCRANVERDRSGANVEIRHQDLRDAEIENASIVAMNFTLQFIPVSERASVLAKIARGIIPGGALVVAEKIRFADSARQEFMTNLHHEFKRLQGYSDLEIAQKRTALENVMITETEEEHIERLREAGFSTVDVIGRCINFAAFLAIR